MTTGLVVTAPPCCARAATRVFFRQLGLPRTGGPAGSAGQGGAQPPGVSLGAAGVALALAGFALRRR
jgi:hypothetical protein